MKKNIIIIMTDQQRADLSAREGYPLDTTPAMDRLARSGTWFNKAYTTMPLCVPARTSLITGRYPSVNGVKANPNISTAVFKKDLFQVAKDAGYKRALIGKNHTYVTSDDVDYMFDVEHMGYWGDDLSDERRKFNDYLCSTKFSWNLEPTPFPVEMQNPHLIVDKAMDWIGERNADEPFIAEVSFPEPHNPYQCPEPYYSMFPVEDLPPLESSAEDAVLKGMPYVKRRELQLNKKPNQDNELPKVRSIYHGMLRMIDDQVGRLIEWLEETGMMENSIIIYLSDHGEQMGEYGLYEKNTGLSETLAHIPMSFAGAGINASDAPHSAHVSLADIMPTCCEIMGQKIPLGVQGRSLLPLLTGDDYPKEEFSSISVEQGFGGNFYQGDEDIPPNDVEMSDKPEAWCNSLCHGGNMRMIRKDDWKLIYDSLGRGELYDLPTDPAELKNQFDNPEHADKKNELLADLLKWTIRLTDPLPAPVKFELQNIHSRNYNR